MKNTNLQTIVLVILTVFAILFISLKIIRNYDAPEIETFTLKTDNIQSVTVSYNSGYIMYLDSSIKGEEIKIIGSKSDCKQLMSLYSEYNTYKDYAIKDSISNTFEIKLVNGGYILEKCR